MEGLVMKVLAGWVVLLSVAILTGCSGECEDLEANRAVVVRATEILNSHDYTDLGEVMADDFRRHCQATPDAVVESLDDFKALLAMWDGQVPDAKITTEWLIAEGDLVAIWGTWSGTQVGPIGDLPATGKTVNLDFGGVHRIENGKIAETWVTWDNVSMLTQLGLFPPPAPEPPPVE
jgi:steroid delta-isomerase-like uncharacterized protein